MRFSRATTPHRDPACHGGGSGPAARGVGPASGAATGRGPEPEGSVPHPGGTPRTTADPTAPCDAAGGTRPLRHRRAAAPPACSCPAGWPLSAPPHRPARSDETRRPGQIRAADHRGLTAPTRPGKHTATPTLHGTAAPPPSATARDVRRPFTGPAIRSSPAAPFTVAERHPCDAALTITGQTAPPCRPMSEYLSWT
ncbi:hypothetical protein GCM10023082_62250 [Streptomyces tremellae]|uniref:Uncharacterized protein n=1 Tax=Streptomyces tremellae TaxID=1124239 RepID=A0ABP7GAR1_9ACTN